MSVMAESKADASTQIEARINELDDWRGKTLSEVRQII